MIKLLIGALAGAVLVAGGYTFYHAQGASYLSNDPQVCVNCHIMRGQFESWQKSSHHPFAACGDCHLPQDFINKWRVKAGNGYHHSAAFTLQNFHEPIRIKEGNARVLDANCRYCHRDFVREISAHRVLEDEEPSCVRCHGNAGHAMSR